VSYVDFMNFTTLSQMEDYSLKTDDSILRHCFVRLLTLAVVNQARSYLFRARESAPELRRKYYREVVGSQEILSGQEILSARLFPHPEKRCTDGERAIIIIFWLWLT